MGAGALSPWILNILSEEGDSFFTAEKLNLETRPDYPVRRVPRLYLLLQVLL